MKKNKAIPQGYMTVGEVAKKMNVSVRTLQYYDKEGLFTPSAESDSAAPNIIVKTFGFFIGGY